MLHQENSEIFVRHHTEQLACGNLRGSDDGRSNFLPEKSQIAVCQREENAGQFQEELRPEVHASKNNTAICPANASTLSSMNSRISEAVRSEHNKRPVCDDMRYKVECKRPRQEEQIIFVKDHGTMEADDDILECSAYRTCNRSLNSPSFISDQSEEDTLDSPIRLSIPPSCVEDYLRAAGFYQSEEVFSPVGVRKPVSIGPNHQAEIPECRLQGLKNGSKDDHAVLSSPSHMYDDNDEDESDKWIRNSVMPMPDSDALPSKLTAVYCKKGCDCLDQGSINCVRQHVRQARENLKNELGLDTFKELGFCDMGEEVALRWTEEEEHLFQEVVSSNPASLSRNFWDELLLAFPSRSRRELVSYYFNVFMLRKRAEQNRSDPMNVDSDNDEWQESDDGEFAMTEGDDDEDLPVESLTDQDDGICNKVPLEDNIQEESDEEEEEDEFDYTGEGKREDYCAVEGDLMVSKGLPAMSFMDQNQQTFSYDADVQDDSCTSFEAHLVGPAHEAPNDIAEDHGSFDREYRNDGLSGVADHGYFGSHCDPKTWDIGFTSGMEKHEFLSTHNVIEEVFGKGSCENDDPSGNGII